MEQQAVTVADRGHVDLPIALRMPANQVAFGRDAVLALLLLIVFLLLTPVLLGDLHVAALATCAIFWYGTGTSLSEDQRLLPARDRDEVAPDAFRLFVLHLVRYRGGCQELREGLRVIGQWR